MKIRDKMIWNRLRNKSLRRILLGSRRKEGKWKKSEEKVGRR